MSVPINPFSAGTHFYQSFASDKTFLLTLGRVYGGQKINGQSLDYFDLYMSFLSFIKSINNKQNKNENASPY